MDLTQPGAQADDLLLEALLQRLGNPTDLADQVHRAVAVATGDAAPAQRHRHWPRVLLMAAAVLVTIAVAVMANQRNGPPFADAAAAHGHIAARSLIPVDREYRVSDSMGLSGRMVTRGADCCYLEVEMMGPFGRMRCGIDGDRCWWMMRENMVLAGTRAEFGQSHPMFRMLDLVDAALQRLRTAGDLQLLEAGGADAPLVLQAASVRTRITADGITGELRALEAPWFIGRIRLQLVRELALPQGFYAHTAHHGADAKVTAPGMPPFMDWFRPR